ncbi:hypothetical protein [Paracoccus sp. IB05]|uniref:hypothetical protein n=1 Tax=Paracoccus sp. IB05 TaxID=2779367 RepID=UPI0018E8DE6B|nr:hypothetical protein [Paracoccus sp. IB05]MBJ2151662.1 hypothetical protein [Paracoccus sp. IB05]
MRISSDPICNWVPVRATDGPSRLEVLSELQEPVSSYRDALWRLFEYQREAGIDYQKTPMPWAIRLVADMFWIEPRKVRADLIKMAQVS